jgi:hypothetical protein
MTFITLYVQSFFLHRLWVDILRVLCLYFTALIVCADALEEDLLRVLSRPTFRVLRHIRDCGGIFFSVYCATDYSDTSVTQISYAYEGTLTDPKNPFITNSHSIWSKQRWALLTVPALFIYFPAQSQSNPPRWSPATCFYAAVPSISSWRVT